MMNKENSDVLNTVLTSTLFDDISLTSFSLDPEVSPNLAMPSALGSCYFIVVPSFIYNYW